MIISFSFPVMFLFFSLIISGDDVPQKPLEVVPSVDLARYAGTWHEIARYPNRFQRDCAGGVTATYTPQEDGTITVVNRCRQSDGSMKEAVGKARRASDEGPNTKLEVRFAPAILSILPFVWGKYWVIDLADDYSYAVIGEPGREYLWILARSSSLDEEIYGKILERIARQGYDVAKIVRTPE